MAPSVYAIEHIEMIRDGGSLWASYTASDGASYTLGFPIKIQDLKRTGFDLPFLSRCIHIERDGIRVGHRHEDVVRLSWPDAKALLESMTGYVDQRNVFQWRHFEEMLYVASHDGGLPPSITPDFR